MLRYLSASLFATSVLLGACAGESIQLEEDHDGDEPVGQISAALDANATVNEAITESCTTASVKGLATQLVEEIQCLRPNTMKRIDNVPGVNLGEAVFPFLQTPAADALITAQKVRNVPMSLNSGLRTLPQQFLLYRWSKMGRCGIGLAASPGTSNHESAIAIDIQDNAAWRSALQGKGFRWLGANDPVHYDFTAKGTVDIRGLSVRAFQRLWNRNHPEEKIGEDGKYGDETEKRIARSPANGFPIGAKCDEPIDGVPEAPPMTEFPESADATEDPSTTTQNGKKKSGADDEDDANSRERAAMASAGCNVQGSSGADAWPLLALLGLAFVRKGARRRAR